MFTQELPPQVYSSLRDFIRVMNANRDFVWWAETLITEETNELEQAYIAQVQDMENIFKELADVIYVVAGFYCVLPNHCHLLIDDETNDNIQKIMNRAGELVSQVVHDLKIPFDVVLMCFLEVHESNMTKVNPKTGKPNRREDGKILKGPNYVPPSFTKPLEKWNKFIKNRIAESGATN